MRPRPTTPSVLPANWCAHEFAAIPAMLQQALISRGDVARHRQHHGHRVFGGADGVAGGGVHHDDAQPRGGFAIDVVGADAGANDRLEPMIAGQSDSAVIFTPLRQIAPSNWASDSRRASPFSPVRTSYSIPLGLAASNKAKPSGLRVSKTIMRGMVISAWWEKRWGECDAVFSARSAHGQPSANRPQASRIGPALPQVKASNHAQLPQLTSLCAGT